MKAVATVGEQVNRSNRSSNAQQGKPVRLGLSSEVFKNPLHLN